MIGIGKSVRHGIRGLARRPGFGALAVLTLALGIGATTAVYSVLDAVVLRPLPYPDPEQLVRVWRTDSKNPGRAGLTSYQDYDDFSSQAETISPLAALSPLWQFVWQTPAGPEQVPGYYVSGNFFRMLGIKPLHGRLFSAQDDRPGAEPVAVLSYGFWRDRFGSDPNIVGKTIDIFHPVPVAGVLPSGFWFGEEVAVWVPLAHNPLLDRGRGVRFLSLVGRLAPGNGLNQARGELTSLALQLAKNFPEADTGLGVAVIPLQDDLVGSVRPALLFLLAAVGMVLLIACVNVANLLLSRAVSREHEVAVRLALGASPQHLAVQFFLESLLLAVLGGVGGLLLASWCIDLLLALGPADIPRRQEITLDARVLVFAVGITLLTGLLAGIAPVLQARRVNMRDALKQGAGRLSGGRQRLRSLLVTAEVALAFLLLVGAGLAVRSFIRLMEVDPGFFRHGVLTLQINLEVPEAGERATFYHQLFDRLEKLPGVISAGGVTRIPLGQGVSTKLEIQGRPVPEGQRPEVEFRRATPDYFPAMGIALLRGRLFNRDDDLDSSRVVLLNAAAAQQLWPGEDPLGKRVRFFASDSNWWTVVGVVADVRHFGLDTPPRPEVYMNFYQGPPFGPFLAIRTTGDPRALVPAVKEQIRALNPNVVIAGVAPIEERVSASVAQRRFGMYVAGAFGLVALILAVVGIYGVVSYMVGQRTHEIGIRMALGARPAEVFRLVISRGLALAGLGILLGGVAALALSRLIGSFLYGLKPTDPLTYAGVVVLLAAVTVVACWLPARRAMRVDPLTALRYE